MKSRIDAKTRLILGIFFALLLVLLIFEGTSAAKFPDLNASQIRDDIILVGALDKSNSVDQSFVAQKPYLSSIKFLLDSNDNEESVEGGYRLFVHLQDSRRTEIAFKSFSIPSSAEKLVVEFSFPPQSDSLGKRYYLLIETNASANTLSVWCSLFDSYPNGSIYLNENLSPFDLTFWTYYKPALPFFITDTFTYARPRFTHLFFISFAFFFLGLLVRILLGCLSKNLIEEVIYSIGVGICIPPLLFLILSLLRIPINRLNILVIFSILIIFTGIKIFMGFKTGIVAWHFPIFNREEVYLLVLMFLLAAFSRVAQVNDLAVPNWVDGIIHQEFLTRILERQFMSFDAIYPKGFHANVIFDYLLFGESLSESILIMGQWLSLISGLTFYMLARKLLRTPYGLFAVGIYWFWTAFPAFLINWGRYPFLQGLVLLPIAITIFQDDFLGTRSRNTLFMLLVIGLELTYYGSFLIFAAFLITDLVYRIFKDGAAEVIQRIKGIPLFLFPIILLLLIRLYHALGNGFFGQASAVASVEDSRNAIEIFMMYGSWAVWLLGVIGMVLVFWLEYEKLFFLIEWVFILFAFNLLQAGFGITISSFANTIIFLSIPLALLAGFTFKILLVKITRHFKLRVYISLVLISMIGAYSISGLIKPATVLYLPADQKAMEWINHNTPEHSVFIINSFLWGDIYAPSDGGGWLSLITERKSILFDYNKFEDMIDGKQINYIYVGRGYGDINPDVILNDHRFLLVYNKDGIRIFKLNLQQIQ